MWEGSGGSGAALARCEMEEMEGDEKVAGMEQVGCEGLEAQAFQG